MAQESRVSDDVVVNMLNKYPDSKVDIVRIKIDEDSVTKCLANLEQNWHGSIDYVVETYVDCKKGTLKFKEDGRG